MVRQHQYMMLLRKFLWIFIFIELYYLTNVSCEDGISLAFAIDDTRSMWDDIEQVRREAKNILRMVLTTKSSEVKDFVLVTINDPDVILRTHTKSPGEFLSYLNSIKTHNYGNYDCAERVLTGIEKALMFSKPESYIYVFTDATTKELPKLKTITRLCQKKQSQVVFVLTGDCGMPNHRQFTVYYDVAKACSGQVFRVKKNEVHTVLKTVEILLKGKNSIFKWKTIPKTSKYVPVNFTLDEKAEYAIISTSGTNVNLKVTTIPNLWGPQPSFNRTMWNGNGKVITLVNPKPGTYYAWVKGQSTISVVIYGRTDFTFGYGFSVLEPKSMVDTVKQPIAGLKQHLSINVTDPDNSVKIESVQILDIKNNDRVIKELPLRNIGENIYITEAYISPNETFKISVKGGIKKTNETIIRNSRHIDPQIVDLIPESKPEIKIDEGPNSIVDYGSGVTLTCKVTAHPAPKIDWYTAGGVLLPSNSSVLEDPSFVSYLKLSNIKQNETYVCKASNKLGGGTDGRIQVGVRPVFTHVITKEPVHNAKYGEVVKIPCNIKSYLPITIKWYRSGKLLSGNTGEYSVSANGSELTLKSMNIGTQGKYTCEATLNSDVTVKQSDENDVTIPGLALPKIQLLTDNISVMKGENILLNCNIVKGYPKPQVVWFKKTGNTYVQLINGNNEVLTVNKAVFMDAGHYKCKAINPMGTDMATFVIKVRSIPKISIAQKIKEVPYDSHAEFSCHVESSPASNIIWKDESRSVLPSQLTKISEYESTSILKLRNIRRNAVYYCYASNDVGSVNNNVQVKALSPFQIKKHIKDTIGVTYGNKQVLECDVKSTKPMTVKWYKEKIGIKSRRSLISSSDKYAISEDGRKLTINSMDMDTAGKYTCEASLILIPTEKLSFTTTANVVGLSGPEVIYSTTVTNDRNYTAICRIKGVPRPKISWQFKPKGSEKFSIIPGSGEELNIPELKLNHTGVYKCIAQNHLGSTEREYNLVVKERPIITNEQSNYYALEGDLVLKIPCDVTGFPEPTIVWRKNGNVLIPNSKYRFEGSTLYISTPVKADSGEFTCVARNSLGTATNKVSVEVTVPIPESKPEIKIYEGTKLNVDHGSGVTLTCKVTAHPAPKIEWFTSSGILLPSQSSELEDPYFLSYLKRNNIKQNETYVCKASNKLGVGTDRRIEVGVKPVFTRIPTSNEPSSVHNAKYGEEVKIPCTIKSYLPITIKWYRSGELLSGNTGKYSVSADGSELTLKSMNIGTQGKYTCEATLNSDVTVKLSHDNEVKIPGLAVPKIKLPTGNINVMKGGKIVLNCNIAQGYPKPQVVWFKEVNNSYVQLIENNEVLTVNNVIFMDAGQYKCKATNPMGSDSATFDIKVRSVPKISIAEIIKEVPYDSHAEFSCHVESSPAPNIIWKDESRSVLPSQVTKISEYKSTSKLILQNIRRNAVYSCYASNEIGSVNDNVQVKVLSPFQIKNHIKDTIGVTYGNNQVLECDVKSAKPMTIKWYKERIGIKSRRLQISSSDTYVISEDGRKLTINSMDMHTVGKYTCEASLVSIPTEKVTFSTTVNVAGLVRPEVTDSTTIMNNRNFTAICRIKGVPRPEISWLFMPKGSEKFSQIPGSGEEMNIPEIKLNHTGVYKCIAQSVLGSAERDLNLVVKERPIITNKESNYYALEGDLVLKMPCDVTGFPEPTIVWKKEGNILLANSKYQFKGSTLYINTPVQADSGEFTCEARNSLGIATKNVSVEVVDNFIENDNFNGDTVDVDAIQGKSNSIRCNLDYTEEDSVRWYMDGVYINKTGSTYTIEEASNIDEGNFTCRVNTNEGSKSETYVVYFGYAPIFEDNIVETIAKTIDWHDANQVLDCAADSQPPPEYKWLHNGNLVETGMDSRHIRITDWGKYTCQVSNAHGNISRNFEVTTIGCYISMNAITQNQPIVSDTKSTACPDSVSNSDIYLKENEDIKLSCPNQRTVNAFKMIPSKQELIAKCKIQDKFIVDGNIYKYSDLQCNTKVEPSVLSTEEQCRGPNSEIIRVGFELNKFMEIYNVCFDRNLSKPIYASAVTHLSRDGDGVDPNKFEWNTAPEINNRSIIPEVENWRTQGSCKCCYTKGQLVNLNELAFGPAQSASFKDNLNSIPIWNPCGDSGRASWDEFDNEIRRMSSNEWSTWTGASDWAPTKDGLVPTFLWKVVHYDSGSTVIVYANKKSPNESDVRCSNPCETLMEADPYLYCCTLEEFSEKFGLPIDQFKTDNHTQ